MTVTAIESRQPDAPAAALAVRPGQEMWTDKQRAALSTLGIKDASSADLAVFMHYCQKTGLDPFSRQIYMIGRREKQGNNWITKQTIQVGIDGFRVIRDRVAARLGIRVEYEDTVWYDADGNAHTVWLSNEAPVACNVTVVKDGMRYPGTVRTAAYCATNSDGKPIAQWRNQPDHMIEKCAEAFALRRAFPNDLGGLYIAEEMANSTGSPAASEAPRPARITLSEITGQKPQGEPSEPEQDDQPVDAEVVVEDPPAADWPAAAQPGGE